MNIRCVGVLIVILCCACGPTLTTDEKGALAGYVLGSGAGAGLGVAAGDPKLGALVGGPAGAVLGVMTAKSWSRDQQIRELHAEISRLESEMAVQREGMRRLARKEWLEP